MANVKCELIKKVKGIYFDHNGCYNEEFVNSTIKTFRKLNYTGLGILYQSIHHINYMFNDEKNIDKIVIKFRKAGIKPEDIDGFHLMKKKEKEQLTSYEQLTYGMWKKHYDSDKTFENKQILTIVRELQKLKNKWGLTNVSYKNIEQYEIEELKKEAEDLILAVTKYERM